jgi:hypothetical protein
MPWPAVAGDTADVEIAMATINADPDTMAITDIMGMVTADTVAKAESVTDGAMGMI